MAQMISSFDAVVSIKECNGLVRKIRKNSKGFTLVELIIVIAIVAVLSAVAAPQYIKYIEKSKIIVDMDTASAIQATVEVLCADGTITTDDDDYVTWDVSAGSVDHRRGHRR